MPSFRLVPTAASLRILSYKDPDTSTRPTRTPDATGRARTHYTLFLSDSLRLTAIRDGDVLPEPDPPGERFLWHVLERPGAEPYAQEVFPGQSSVVQFLTLDRGHHLVVCRLVGPNGGGGAVLFHFDVR